jgi:hypothetical protein
MSEEGDLSLLHKLVFDSGNGQQDRNQKEINIVRH